MATGNVRTAQLRSGDRTGTGDRVVTAASGSLTSGNYPKWDANGNLTAGDTGGSTGSSLPWVSWTAPVDGDFSWINQGGASITARTSPTRLLLTAPASASNNVRIRKKTAPATPYVITAWFFPALGIQSTSNNPNCGLLFRESGSGKLHLFCVTVQNGNSWAIESIYNSSATAWSSTPKSISAWAAMLTGAIGLRIADDGSNRICSVTQNGEDWKPVHTVGRTTHLTADEVGFFCESQSSTEDSSICLVSWSQS